MTPEYILFWFLVGSPPNAVGGFDEQSCARAAQHLRTVATTVVEPEAISYGDSGQRAMTRGEIWCEVKRVEK